MAAKKTTAAKKAAVKGFKQTKADMYRRGETNTTADTARRGNLARVADKAAAKNKASLMKKSAASHQKDLASISGSTQAIKAGKTRPRRTGSVDIYVKAKNKTLKSFK
jgi:hypothetical protein